MQRTVLAIASSLFILSEARADVTVSMEKYDSIPQVEIVQGIPTNDANGNVIYDCGNASVFKTDFPSGDLKNPMLKHFSHTWSTVTGEVICFRRTDFDHTSQLTKWQICFSDCRID